MKTRPRHRSSLARQAGIAALFMVAALLGILAGVLAAYTGDLPEVTALDEYTPSTITRVLASDGSLVGEYATQRRVLIKYEDIPPVLRQAIMSAEDAGFESHFGLKFSRILVTAIKDIVFYWRSPTGASTLTQMLARKLFLKPEKTLERKIKEAVLAIQIERRYTKREIFTLFCNQMDLGHGAYGVEAASRMYFGKAAKNLKLEEAALIAGILQLPARQSPYVNLRWATRRRNYALDRMAAEGYISRAESDAAQAKPVVLAGLPAPGQSVAPYFVEEVRKHLEHQYGARELYEAGLVVHTTLDAELQRAANRALDHGLRQLEKRRGFRRPARNVLSEGQTLEGYRDRRWDRPIRAGDVVPAVVMGVSGPRDRRLPAATIKSLAPGSALVRAGRHLIELTRADFKWTGRQSAAELFRTGDLIEVAVTGIDGADGTITATLDQTPQMEGALLAIENRTGQIRAMVGGFDFGRSKFNRAVQAPRQIGSAFKPIVFTAAIDRGYTPSTMLLDAPVSYNAGAGQPPYAPQNYDRKYEGPVTLRRVLEQSRNVPTVRMMEQLTPGQVISYARRLGFQSPLQPYLSTALGASEATLLEVTSAYSAFPNQGVRMQPYSIINVVERDGTLLEEQRPQSHEGIRADTAFVITNLLQGVVKRGTAAKAAELDWPLGGKTGTVDDYTDAWFVGFDPNITVGVWVGFDLKKPLGSSETGAVTALPIWIEFMKAYIDARGDRKNPPSFGPPSNIVFMTVDRGAGVPVDAGTPGAITEAYIAGTQPGVGFPR